MMDALDAAIASLYRDRLAQLRADEDAAVWGGLEFEAALYVLGDNATAAEIRGLLATVRTNA